MYFIWFSVIHIYIKSGAGMASMTYTHTSTMYNSNAAKHTHCSIWSTVPPSQLVLINLAQGEVPTLFSAWYTKELDLADSKRTIHTNTHTHTYIYACMYR